MDLSVVPYKHHHHHHQSTKVENESEDGDVVEPKSSADKNGLKSTNSNTNVKYRECMRNHAASIGGHANDGCGEFMPCGSALEDSTSGDSLSCAACGCHRNFHRREVILLGGVQYSPSPPPMALLYNAAPATPRWDPKMVVGPPRRHHPPHRNGGRDSHEDGSEREYDRRSSETPEREDQVPAMATGSAASGGGSGGGKRFRTKFTAEQKDRMLEFAERIGWRIQRQDEAAINQFCSQIGVKRNVLKVWMHNNKNAHRRREPLPTTSSTLPEGPMQPPPIPPHSAPQQPVVGV
ncbi:Octamer-binding transcription factor [Trema orientale]|uniref:Octamer-binding transcription factor n=1 Tax=Trema orientale TaxID=63057 RepID=A0A2P5EHM8_TREOI|nr:Octamer-binding transcription factor [Trema orientale]